MVFFFRWTVNIKYMFILRNRLQRRVQDFFQGVAEISSGGGENLPGRINCALPPLPQRFLISYTELQIYPQIFYILDTCYKEIQKIYVFTFSC